MIAEGSALPLFQLPDQDGKLVDIRDFKEEVLIIFFYPKDFTPGCTKEVCNFRDNYEEINKAGAVIFGVSVDSPGSHKNFKEKYHLPFDLLSDAGNKVRKQFGVEGTFFNLFPGRATFIFVNGILMKAFNMQFQAERHVEETLKALNEIRDSES